MIQLVLLWTRGHGMTLRVSVTLASRPSAAPPQMALGLGQMPELGPLKSLFLPTWSRPTSQSTRSREVAISLLRCGLSCFLPFLAQLWRQVGGAWLPLSSVLGYGHHQFSPHCCPQVHTQPPPAPRSDLLLRLSALLLWRREKWLRVFVALANSVAKIFFFFFNRILRRDQVEKS